MTTFNTQDFDPALAISLTDEPKITSVSVEKPLDLPGSNELREYVVIVNEGLTIDDLEKDLERDTAEDDGVDSSIIPDRPINVANRREGSERQTHYWMTFDEAQALKKHPDVLDVELCPDTNPNINLVTHASMTGDFTKQALFGTASGTTVNYALKRCSSPTNNYGTGNTVSGTYDYIADGSGVDIIIMDTGINVNHPEFKDASGNSRVQQIDWYTVSGVAGTMPANFYTDDNGHGTSTAAVAAGKTFGWAKNAKIYVMNSLGTAGTTIDALTAFDLMKKFHQNKGIDPKLGVKRPTIVSASWGVTMSVLSSGGNYNPYGGVHTIYTGYQLWGGNYRGTAWSTYAIRTDYGMNGSSQGTYDVKSDTPAVLYKIPGFSTSYDAALADMIAAGVHFVHAVGNDKVKQELSTGPDYNNYFNIITGISNGAAVLASTYYNRPTSPWAASSIVVGSNDVTPYSATQEQRAYFTNYGTGVDIYAPGVGIVTAGLSGNTYYANSSYFQKNESGTSFSSPQVVGVLALFLQQNPAATPAVAKKWLTTNGQGCVDNILYDTGLTNDYTSNVTLSGGPNKFLNNPFNVGNVSLGSNGLQMLGGIVTLQT